MECGIEWDWPGVLNRMVACLVADHQTRLDDIRYVRPDGKEGFLALTVNPYLDADRKLGLLLLGTDFTERKKLESQLSHAQKMESIGQLAAGIAHEINTPIQYVGDNTRFVQQSFIDMSKLRESYEKLHTAVANGEDARALIEEIVALRREIDIEYVVQEIPRAIKESLDGIERVADIVRSMKDFAHPDTGSKALTDLNKNIETTLKVARNEWKYVAEMETDLDPSLPMVACFPGEINQVILNLIVNAAHAIADVVGDGASGKGRIRVSSHRVDPWVEIRVSDTGTGIPEAIRSRIFDPFFTTKEVGRGTGQGLAIAHTVIVEKHGGTINFETEMGRGTRFIIRLPQERIQEGKDGA
jgi:signal transduction histidine kinase